MPTVDDARSGRKIKRARRAPAASEGSAAATTQLQVRTAEQIAAEQTVERLAVRIWVALVAQKILGDMSTMLDALIDSHLFTDSDEEADEGWLDDRHKREKEILDGAIAEALDAYPDIAAIADIPDSSDASIAGDIKQLKG